MLLLCFLFFFFKQRTAYEMRISDWSSDVCSSDLQNRVIRPNPHFRLFSTANTVGLGDTSGLYHGTQQINQGQMDRWNIVVTLNYLPAATESAIILAKVPNTDETTVANMV